MTKKLLTLLALILLATGMSWADTWTYTFEGKVFTNTSGETKSLNGKNWSAAYKWAKSGKFLGGDATKGQQFGSGSYPASEVTLKTSDFSGTITKVTINASIASNGKAQIASVDVGGTKFKISSSKSSATLTVTSTDYSFTGSNSGDLTIKFTNTVRAFYVKSITVEYSPSGSQPTTDVTAPTFSPAAGAVPAGTQVTISGPEGATIYYTTDDSDPSDASTKYTAPVVINEACTLKAIAYDANGNKSTVVSADYTIKSSTTTEAKTITFTAGKDIGDAGTITKDGVTIRTSSGTFDNFYSEYRLYSGSTTTFTSTVGNITKVVIKTASGYYASNFSLVDGSAGSYSGGTWTGDASTFQLKAGKQIRVLEIIVYIGNVKEVTSLSFAEPTKSIEVDQTYTNKLTTSPSNLTGITFKSSDESIATVDENGQVTGKAVGEVTITASFPGNDSYEASEATYKLTVTPATISAPTFSPVPGVFTNPVNVTIAGVTDATIYYTTDGTEPTDKSTVYSAAIPVSATTTIKAIAIKNGIISEVATATYTIKNAPGPATGDTYYLVEDLSTLTPGEVITFVGKKTAANNTTVDYVAMGSYYDDKKTSSPSYPGYYLPVDIEMNDKSFKAVEGITDLKLVKDDKGYWHFEVLENGIGTGNYLSIYATANKQAITTVNDLSEVSSAAEVSDYMEPVYKVGSHSVKFGLGQYGDGSVNDKIKNIYLRYNNYTSGLRFNLYDGASTCSAIWIYRKEAGTALTLKQAIEQQKNNEVVTLSGTNLRTVSFFSRGETNYLVVKDEDGETTEPAQTDHSGLKEYLINGSVNGKQNATAQADYDQSNWLLVAVPASATNNVSASDVNRYISSITGTINTTASASGYNSLQIASASAITWATTASAYTPNMYCPVNFMTNTGSNAVKADGYTSSYFFMNPKRTEYAQVVWAVYNGYETVGSTKQLKFYVPAKDDEGHNYSNLHGGFVVNLALNETSESVLLSTTDAGRLVEGDSYDFLAIVGRKLSTSGSAPKRVSADVTTISSDIVVYPLNLSSSSVVTAVSDVDAAKAVKSVRYYNLAGQASAQPYEGLNIVRTTYTDGTSSVAKVMR